MNPVHFSSASTEWSTPDDFFAQVVAEFGPFDLDVCATAENAKASRFYTREQNGLDQNWEGLCWMNPPYGREIRQWVALAWASAADQGRDRGILCRVVSLLPARTDTHWWHIFIWDQEAHCPYPGVQVRFIKGRLKFGGSKNSAPFPSALVVFG